MWTASKCRALDTLVAYEGATVAAVCGCVAVGSPLQMLSVRMYHNLFSPGFVLCVSLVCAVLCCAVQAYQ
jgi:hypothetical protein